MTHVFYKVTKKRVDSNSYNSKQRPNAQISGQLNVFDQNSKRETRLDPEVEDAYRYEDELYLEDFDYEIESKEEQSIRKQLESYQQKKHVQMSSQKGKSEKTKCSENQPYTDADGTSSLGEVTVSSGEERHNACLQYFHDPSIMKRNKLIRGDDYLNLEHPSIKQRLEHNQFKQTDLNKIKNVRKGSNQSIKNTKFFNFGVKNFM